MRTDRLKSERPRRANDFYPTPYGLAKAALETLLMDTLVVCGDDDVLDVGAGSGIWGDALLSTYQADFEQNTLTGIDIMDVKDDVHWYYKSAYNKWYYEDYLTWSPTHHYDLIMGNPPYSLMEEFVRKSFEIVNSYGYIFFLGRLEFLASQKRYHGLWKDHPLHTLYVLSRRPSFFSTKEGRKTTDYSQEYAMYLWQKDSNQNGTGLEWLYWEYDKEND